ncbi:hypothetical protein [Paraliobacillus sp. JSM ZJ581]|uniref:hypothetical protein n=1 Tax=Paraliobacillus sp. JSM ZJ581 TaxID=3342118 RepID=UPI0035A84AE7
MGYVLPVTNYQYYNYHTRVTLPERDPYPIEQLYPIQLDMAYQKETENEKIDISELSNYHKKNSLGKTPTSHNVKVTEGIYTNLTGTGRYFNKVV